MRSIITLSCIILAFAANAQTAIVSGTVVNNGMAIAGATVTLKNKKPVLTDSLGAFVINNIEPGKQQLQISAIGFFSTQQIFELHDGETKQINIHMQQRHSDLQDVVVTGTLKEVKRTESAVAVEVYTPAFFKKNPTCNIYEALQNVNGVRPQLNCQVCNTGDIHINGLEGPYTMVLLDGMPIVSSLSTVYGLSGIPNSLVERIEIVKGPASSLYGSEAVGGLINIITKRPETAAKLVADIFTTSWGEINTDIGFTGKISHRIHSLTGLNYFLFNNRVDHNQDGFTDITLQNRVSAFQKFSIARSEDRVFTIAGRYLYEDRWGGDTRWQKKFRGGDSIYAESIYTGRWELLSTYQLPVKEKMLLAISLNGHHQNSVYGTTIFNAIQKIAFAQLTWDKKINNHDLLFGAALRYTYYDDNTPATASGDPLDKTSRPQKTKLPGIFLQDEISISGSHKLLLGLRYDHHNVHGNILTPRLAHKWTIGPRDAIRLNAGTGFRVVNLFTEDHAALTGARKVVVNGNLEPERSYNANINYLKKLFGRGLVANIDLSVFYTYFNNRIVGDFDSNPNEINYHNLNGYASSRGITLNTDLVFKNGLKIIGGGTLMENKLHHNGKSSQQILTEKFTGTWSVSFPLKKQSLSIDYTGNVYSPMRLPLLGSSDPRKPYSPWWSVQNIQLSFSGFKKIEIYGGVKNLLNFTPTRNNPFIIARSHDPFDKNVQYDNNGNIMATPENPYALSFDPNYVYAPNQGIRAFIGMRYRLQR